MRVVQNIFMVKERGAPGSPLKPPLRVSLSFHPHNPSLPFITQWSEQPPIIHIDLARGLPYIHNRET